MTEPRLLINAPLAAGADIALDEARARHVGTVLRLGLGKAVRLFNARDGEWRARIAVKDKRAIALVVEDFLRPARPVPDLELMFAPVKRHATDLIVEKATELGARRIRPVITQRTIAETVRLDRLAVIAREAVEQSERFEAPEICAPVSLAKALDGWDVERALIYCDEHGDAMPMLAALSTNLLPRREGGARSAPDEGRADTPAPARLRAPHPPTPSPEGGGGALSVLIGPEGGFTGEERAMLRALAFVIPVSLGPRILRAETATIAALAIIQAAWGDWRGP